MAEPTRIASTLSALSSPSATGIDDIVLSDAAIRERCTRLATEFSTDMVRYGLGHMIPVLKSVQSRAQFERIIVGVFDHTIRVNAGDWRVEGTQALKADHDSITDPRDPHILVYAHHSHVAESASLNRALYEVGLPLTYHIAGTNLASDTGSQIAFQLLQMVGQPRAAGPHEMIKAREEIGTLIKAGEWVTTASTPGLIRKGNNKTDPRVVKSLKKATGSPSYDAFVEDVAVYGVATNYGVAPGWHYRAERDATGQKPLGFDKLMVIASLKEPYESFVQVIGPRVWGHFETAQDLASALDETIQGAHPILPEDFAAYANLLGYSALHEARVNGFSDKAMQRVDNELKRLNDLPIKIAHAAMHMRTSQIDAWLSHNLHANKDSHNLELIADAAQRYV